MDTGDRTCRKLRRFEPPLLLRWLKLAEEHHRLVEDNGNPEDLLWSLRRRKLWREAVRMLAYTLPEREAVWWSCMCVRHTAQPLEGAERGAVEAAEAWVRRPEATFGQAAERSAHACGFEAPGAWSAIGACWSHRESFSPNVCGGRGAAVAVLKAAARDGADRADMRLRRFIGNGVEVGNGGAGRLPLEGSAS